MSRSKEGKDSNRSRMPGEPVGGLHSTSAMELAILRGVPWVTDGHGVGAPVGRSIKGDKQRAAKQRGRQERQVEACGGKTWKKRSRGKSSTHQTDYSCDVDQTSREAARAEARAAYWDTFCHDYDPDTVHIGTAYGYP